MFYINKYKHPNLVYQKFVYIYFFLLNARQRLTNFNCYNRRYYDHDHSNDNDKDNFFL